MHGHGHSHGHGHDHNGAAGVLVLIGDSIHNALDGILIAAAFLTSVPLGLVTTLAVAALFNPLRTRVQRLVDRRFNRARYDREALVVAFGAKLRDAVDSETVVSELAGAAAGAVEPVHVSVWIPS